MKFAQYLQDTQTPEWKKAYIDYRGLKKRITAIRKARQGLNIDVSSDNADDEVEPPSAPRPSDVGSDDIRSLHDIDRPTSLDHDLHHSMSLDKPTSLFGKDNEQTADKVLLPRLQRQRRPSTAGRSFTLPSLRTRAVRTLSTRLSIGGAAGGSGNGSSARHPNPLTALPLHELLTHLSPHEVSFFTMLDAQLDKVESFFLAREKEMLSRGQLLQIQLKELDEHRKLFLETKAKPPWSSDFATKLRSLLGLYPTKLVRSETCDSERVNATNFVSSTAITRPIEAHIVKNAHTNPDFARASEGSSSALNIQSNTLAPINAHTRPSIASTRYPRGDNDSGNNNNTDLEDARSPSSDSGDVLAESTVIPHSASSENGKSQVFSQIPPIALSADPDSYLSAKRKLKRAVVEYYRGLEMLHNYRVLNITGFRKALKKFEKVTRIIVQNQYMTEKVEASAFASDKSIKQMMSTMEEFYATSFARGDKKKATSRLRGGSKRKSHHFSTFRSGMVLGLAIPLFASGLVKVFKEDTRAEIPAWDALVFIYGLLFIPTFFSLLIGVNLLVWSRCRINYSFIFELDVNSHMDYREYFETPSILLAMLCICFWLSFAQIGGETMPPNLWPLVWLAFTAFMLFQPFHVYFKTSRYWLIRHVSKLFLSGTRRVEFTDFWMGDQFCSLVFTISNLYLFACTYAHNFPEDWSAKCSSAHNSGPGGHGWLIAFALASVPFIIRFVQSVKRYMDSKLITHLINGGKYASGITSYFFYFLWKHSGQSYGKAFAFWCLFNTCYSIYACSWDFLMDWSVLQPRSQHRFLRSELVYQHYVPLYYFAMVSNLLLRFIWVIYIPHHNSSTLLRSFIVGLLEVLRRWQWNFYRLENEHIGNMDQYRVTREVPLPYVFDDHSSHQDRDDDEDEDNLKMKKR